MFAAWFGLIAIGEALAATWFIRRTNGASLNLERVGDMWALIIASALVPIAGATIGALLSAPGSLSSFFDAWRSWWLADALGILAVVPVLIPPTKGHAAFISSLGKRRLLELAAVYLGIAILAEAIFGEFIDPRLTAPTYVLPFLLWPAFRFGPGQAGASVLIVAVISLWNSAHGQGPMMVEGASAGSMALRAQGALMVASISFLLLASVVAERRRIAHENAELVIELQRVLAEVKTLRGFIPICAWCHKIRDDAGFWQQIEMYLDARTDATFSHSICPTCAEQAHSDLTSHDASEPGRYV